MPKSQALHQKLLAAWLSLRDSSRATTGLGGTGALPGVSSSFLALALLLPLPSAASEPAAWNYGKRGWEWSAADTGSYLWLGMRFQGRYDTHLEDRHDLSDLQHTTEAGFEMSRARYKIGAGFREVFSFYHEYDLRNERLLDLRATWTASPRFNLRIGQWKAQYNRERIDSSGKQQFVERSIATYWFTVDRQWGAMASGRAWEGSAADSSWWAGVLGGNGRSNDSDGGRPMVIGRWQWNYTGSLLPFSQSALKRYESPHGSLSFAAVANDSRYTRFSSNGGGQLPEYEEGEDNQYRIYQAMQEWAWQRRGLSFQQELHWKSISDRIQGGKRNIWGGYAQAGWFPAQRWPQLSDKLEFALRAAYVDPDSPEEQDNVEYTVAANWFFNGHRNKLTLDFSYLAIDEGSQHESDLRTRLQWDLSL